MMDSLFAIATFLLLYTYLGYPALLYVLAKLFPRIHSHSNSFLPKVTFIISARNEERIISEKLHNTLALNYPADRLRIIVVSDMSTDNTDQIVRSFEADNILLLRSEKRRGKTSGINQAMQLVTSDIVVFSDANAFYDAGALRKLVRHFADPGIGYVVGHARYEKNTRSSAAQSEITYWDIEVLIKKWESSFSSVVGGDGAIYGIRSELYEPLQESDINDFVNPLQIVEKGYRGVFDPEAWCTEHAANQYEREFGRKLRIVNRSFNGLLRVPRAANPFVSGRFSWQLISHKALRWFAPFIIGLHFLTALTLVPEALPIACLILYGFAAFMALVGWSWSRHSTPPGMFSIPYYFALVNLASALGILLRLGGTVITVWDTVRERQSPTYQIAGALPLFLFFVIFAALVRIAFWSGFGLVMLRGTALFLSYSIVHTYIGYPILLRVIARFKHLQLCPDESYVPEVTLLIAACNEEKIIKDKLLNSLDLDYPRNKLCIVVASDGSTDATNQIAQTFAEKGVLLFDFQQHRGKIAVINESMEKIDSEIVVLSDANVMYDRTAVRELVRHFSDDRVGAVSGRVAILSDGLSYKEPEALYYSMEHYIQKQEGVTGGMVGADGAMYAIRRSLFIPQPNDTILDDFAISMEIACKGKLILHSPRALGFEKNGHEIDVEFQRRARIIAGGVQCMMRGTGIPKPGQWFLFFKFFSHKLLRWSLGPLTVALIGIILCIHWMQPSVIHRIVLLVLLGWFATAFIGHLIPFTRKSFCIALAHYLMMLNLATFLGYYRGITGSQSVKWRTY
jgi:cellulose synthase/poly-beta-1,6-N-acetylglucosamine synthase-like glycosyltransferase